jgi:hypothetical protein
VGAVVAGALVLVGAGGGAQDATMMATSASTATIRETRKSISASLLDVRKIFCPDQCATMFQYFLLSSKPPFTKQYRVYISKPPKL